MDEDDMGFTEDEIQEISDDDEDYGHLKTKKRHGSLSSQELLERIECDPNHEIFKQYPMSGVLVFPFIVFTVVFLVLPVVVLLFGDITWQSNPGAAVGIAAFPSLYGTCFFCLAGLEHRLYRVVVNSEGIGERGQYGNTAIEWVHIEHIDIWRRGERVAQITFTGNRRHFWLENALFGRKFDLRELVKYVPDFDDWETTREKRWRKGIVRYIRPESRDD